jgi:transcriptional regulator with GAF, ATPase, and Fis domain
MSKAATLTTIRARSAATEHRLLLRTLERHGWNLAHAARELGLWVTSIKRMMVKHGIENQGGKVGRPRKEQ